VNRTAKTILTATAAAGVLDLISAFVFAGMNGVGPAAVMRSVAAGPFGDGMRESGRSGVLVGTLTHFSIMTVMVTVYVLAAKHLQWPLRKPIPAGLGYGLILYFVMYWVILTLRYPSAFPQTGAWQVGNALFSHLICVGLPMALITARMLGAGGRSGR
jgi:hypothetical protein